MGGGGEGSGGDGAGGGGGEGSTSVALATSAALAREIRHTTRIRMCAAAQVRRAGIATSRAPAEKKAVL